MQKFLQRLTVCDLHSCSKNLRHSLKRVAFLSSLFCLAGAVPLWSSDEEKEKEIEDRDQISKSTPCLQNREQSTELELLRGKIKTLEKQENFLEAAQEMDRVLESVASPAVKDLCYALSLNQKASIQERRRNRSQQLAGQISQGLNIDPKAKRITFEASWDQIWPYLDYLIQETVKDPLYEKRKFCYKVPGVDFPNYVEWWRDHMASHKYPIGISGRNNGSKGPKSAEGFAEIYFMEFHIRNNTQKEIEARESFAYRFHGGQLDETRLSRRNFISLMMRAGFKEEDFAKGKHGYQDKILVKPIMLQGTTLPLCFEEFKETISSELKKAKHPYVALVFELNPQTPFAITDLTDYDNQSLHRAFFPQIGEPSATIYEYEEKRIYYCFDNEKRTTLDLHERSYEEASEEVIRFIREKYDNFENECTIITGRGNHVNSNGSVGVLHKSFKAWAKNSELKPMIKSLRPIAGNGGYKVMLHEPQTLTLKGDSQEEHIKRIANGILRTDEAGGNRLIITHDQKQPSFYFDILFARAHMNLHPQSDYAITFQMQPGDNALHLTWFYQQEEDYNKAEKEEIALPFPRTYMTITLLHSTQVTSDRQGSFPASLKDKGSKKGSDGNKRPKKQKSFNNNFQKDIRTLEDYGAYKAASTNGNIQACRALARYHSGKGEGKVANKYYRKANELEKKGSAAPFPRTAKPNTPSAKQKPKNATTSALPTPKLPALKTPASPAKGKKGTFTPSKSSATRPNGAIKPSAPKPAEGVKNAPVPSKPSKTSEMWRVKKAPEKNEKN